MSVLEEAGEPVSFLRKARRPSKPTKKNVNISVLEGGNSHRVSGFMHTFCTMVHVWSSHQSFMGQFCRFITSL